MYRMDWAGSVFGSTLNPPATGTASTSTSSLFPPAPGAPAAGASTSTSPFGAFGQQQQQQQQQGTNAAGPSSAFKPSPFGASTGFGAAPTTTTGFGASTTQPAQNTGAFGQSTLGASTLGASTLNLGQSTAGNANTVEAQINAIEAAITPGNPNNRFQVGIYSSWDHRYRRIWLDGDAHECTLCSTTSTTSWMRTRFTYMGDPRTRRTKRYGSVLIARILALRGS